MCTYSSDWEIELICVCILGYNVCLFRAGVGERSAGHVREEREEGGRRYPRRRADPCFGHTARLLAGTSGKKP